MIQLQSQVEHSSGVARLEFGGGALTSPTWAYSIYPDAPVGRRIATTATLVTGMTYDVTLPSGSFFYLWVGSGGSMFGPFPIEVLSTPPVVNEAAEKLRTILTDNLPEIEYHLRQLLPELHNKFRVVGYKEDLDESNPPWIVIHKPKFRSSRAGIGNLMNYSIIVTIAFCGSVSEDPEDRTPAAASIMESIVTILNRLYYRVITLDSGCQIGDCSASEGASETAQASTTGGYRFFALGSVQWVGQYWATQA